MNIMFFRICVELLGVFCSGEGHVMDHVYLFCYNINAVFSSFPLTG